ncbi:MAG: SNF2-related protein [Deltaproteobacteria bacterium]|nr:SNF2-related protein [Deltaproteobacteria bacterium]
MPWEQRRLYIMQVLKAVEAGEKLDYSEVNFQTQLSLLIRLSRKMFEIEPERLIAELFSEESRIIDLVLEKLPPEGRAFLVRLHREAADYFQKTLAFEVKGLKTPLYAYQKEGAHFLLAHDQAILADEAGLGKSIQVIAAAQTAGFKRILWVTTASNKETIKEEILTHSQATSGDIKIVISGDPRERKAQIAALNGERYLITNYETLVALKKNDPDGYAKLTSNLDVMVLDEAQMTDNEKTLRTAATHAVETKRRWLLTATPYQHKPERIWTLLHLIDPVRYPDYKAFKRFYTESTDGLKLLHAELSKIMLRRTKGDTLTYFEDPSVRSFKEQLADGIPRIPQKIRIPPDVSGAYTLSPEQQDLMAWMIADFNGWAAAFNQNLPDGAEAISLENINSLLKFEMIQRVIYQPEYFGLNIENPIYKALDLIVARRLANGEKIILWAWNQSVVEALVKRYSGLGTARIDGNVQGRAREDARHAFQEDPNTKILVANYISGGVGLTLTAAHAAVFVQLPDGYPLLYQAEGRHQRLIGPENVRHAKDQVEVEWMVPKYSAEFLAGVTNERLRELLTHGTLVEQTRGRLEGGEILYNLLMEGYGDLTELDRHFKSGIIQALGLNREEKIDYTAHLKGEIKDYAETIRAVLPLWNLVQGNAGGEERVLQLIEHLHYYPTFAKDLGKAFEESKTYYSDDLQFIASLFEIKNKYIRNQIFKKLPDLIVRTYQSGKSLTEAAGDLKIGKLTPAVFLATLYAISGQKGEVIPEMARELSAQKDTPAKRYIEEHFLMGVFGIMGQKRAEQFLVDHSSLFSDLSLVHQVHALYRLGLLARVRPDLITEGVSLEDAIYQALGDLIGRPADQVRAMVADNPHWRGNADHLLAFVAGWQDQNEEKIQRQFSEIFRHVVDGDYQPWRMGENNREEGDGIDFMSDKAAFWTLFGENHQSAIERVVVEEQKARATLMKCYWAILQEFAQEGEGAEGIFVTGQIGEYRGLKDAEARQRMGEELQEEIRGLGGQLATDLPLLEKTAVLQKVTELKNVLGWIKLDQSFKEINAGREPHWGGLVGALEAKVKFYHGRKYDKMAEHMEALKDSVVRRSQGAMTFEDITIEDTDDPAILSRMGALHPEMTNCFNPNGNPSFTQHVIAALGSKNMKLIVVRAKGEIVAAVMVKVKSLEDESPVLFLERGIYRKGYDFRKEMLGHLGVKAGLMGEAGFTNLTVMDEVRGKPKEGVDPLVFGTGAYTENEYVESVFGLRRSDNVRHHGRISQAAHPVHLYGIGTSGKSIEAYVGELRQNNVKIVVDVRDRPYGRRPEFNRDRLAASLKEAGIDYVWLGETLGNPKDAWGERSLEGFQALMQGDRYQEGIRQIMSLIQSGRGRVALACAEASESDCHRQFILRDVESRITSPGLSQPQAPALQLTAGGLTGKKARLAPERRSRRPFGSSLMSRPFCKTPLRGRSFGKAPFRVR